MRIEIFIPGVPPNSNAKNQWAPYRRSTTNKKFRKMSAQIAARAKPDTWSPAEYTIVTARHIYLVKRRRDPLGLAERLKGIMDGLVDAGIMPDDDEEHLSVILARSLRGDEPGIHLTIDQEPPRADSQREDPTGHRS